MELLYWHWIILGVILVLFELIIPSFTAMWFGLGAIIVGAILFFEPDLAGSYQVLIWAILSGLLTLFWFRVFKPKRRSHHATKNEVEGEMGLVVTPVSGSRTGLVRFSTPLLGEDEWPFRSDDALEVGQQVKVIDVEQNVLLVTKRA